MVVGLRACSGKRNTSKLADLPALQGRLTKIGELSTGRDLTYLPSKAGKSRKLDDYDVFLFPEQTLILLSFTTINDSWDILDPAQLVLSV